DAEALATVAAAARRHQPRLLVIGRGSNLLVSDAGFSGLVVVLEGDFETVDSEGLRADTLALRAGGAVPLPVLARRAAGGGLAGLEFYVGVPGSVGGAVRMNAGGRGRETVEVGRRIDGAGLKGLRVGGAVVSDKHPNFFQADAGATGRDVLDLVAEVQRRVAQASGVELVPALHRVGDDAGET